MLIDNTAVDIRSSLGDCKADLLRSIGEYSEVPIFLVGGPVRDILLKRNVFDLDIMVQGDALSFVKALYKEEVLTSKDSSKKPVLFKKYKTAKYRFAQEICPGVDALDFASARSEKYASIGSAPECSFGGFEQDLFRRDFSVNAMALSIASDSFGELHDLHSGLEDLSRSHLRVLHENSFKDDPARIIRAVRFMNRFNFSLDSATKVLFDQALEESYLSHLPIKRAFSELAKILAEPKFESVLIALKEIGALRHISKDLDLDSIDDIELLILKGV